jgi:hypothetical protein
MPKEVERAKARIRAYKSGRTIQEVYGPRGDRSWYADDCKLVADWYALNADRIDADRYRWLRAQHHSESTMCVVLNPRQAVIPCSICPSEESLDDYIDRAMEEQAKEKP